MKKRAWVTGSAAGVLFSSAVYLSSYCWVPVLPPSGHNAQVLECVFPVLDRMDYVDWGRWEGHIDEQSKRYVVVVRNPFLYAQTTFFLRYERTIPAIVMLGCAGSERFVLEEIVVESRLASSKRVLRAGEINEEAIDAIVHQLKNREF